MARTPCRSREVQAEEPVGPSSSLVPPLLQRACATGARSLGCGARLRASSPRTAVSEQPDHELKILELPFFRGMVCCEHMGRSEANQLQKTCFQFLMDHPGPFASNFDLRTALPLGIRPQLGSLPSGVCHLGICLLNVAALDSASAQSFVPQRLGEGSCCL